MTITFKSPVPILRVFDEKLMKRFYIEWLGFALDWEHQFDGAGPKYMQVSRGNVVLHLSEHFGDCSPGARVFIPCDDVEALHRELQGKTNPGMNPGLEMTPWNSKCMEVVDPFGNRLTFDQPLK